MLKNKKKGGRPTSSKKKGSTFIIDLDKIPNGRRKPVELCKELKKLRDWPDASSRSNILIN